MDCQEQLTAIYDEIFKAGGLKDQMQNINDKMNYLVSDSFEILVPQPNLTNLAKTSDLTDLATSTDISNLDQSITNISSTELQTSPMYLLLKMWNSLFPNIGVNDVINPEIAISSKLNNIQTTLDNIDLTEGNEKLDTHKIYLLAITNTVNQLKTDSQEFKDQFYGEE